MASVVVIEYFVQLPDHQRRPYTGKQGPPAPKDKKQKGEEKLADGCFQIPVTSAQQQQQSPEGPKSRVTLRDLKWHFPFEGDFHFRARVSLSFLPLREISTVKLVIFLFFSLGTDILQRAAASCLVGSQKGLGIGSSDETSIRIH